MSDSNLKLECWREVTDLGKKKQGPVIALSLPDEHESKIKDKVFNQISLEDLSKENGLETLVTFMDKHLLKDELEGAFDKFVAFEKYERESESVIEYLSEFDVRYRKIEKLGMSLPSHILAFKLLLQANLEKDELMLVKSGMDYTKKDSLYEEAKSSLKKFKSDGLGGNASVNIKVEPVYATFRGSSRGGRGGQQGGFSNRNGNSTIGGQSPSRGYSSGGGYTSRGGTSYRGGNAYRGNYRGGNYGGFSGQGNGRGRGGQNPPGPDGMPRRCRRCGSYMHFVAQCPHENQLNNNGVNICEEIEEDMILYTKDQSALAVLMDEARNSAVLDSACSSTVCGKQWLEVYTQSLDEEHRQKITQVGSSKVFRFGGGTRLQSEGQYTLPACIAGTNVKIQTDVVSSDIPLLLSRDAMKKAKTKLDLVNDCAEILGREVVLNCTSSGHYIVPILPEKVNMSAFAVELDKLDEGERRKTLTKLHWQFGHASDDKLKSLLQDAGVWDSSYSSMLEEIVGGCDTCKRYMKAPPRSVVALPMATKFNEVVAIDLKTWKGGHILHMVDMWSRFSASTFIRKKCPQDVIDGIMKRWVSIFGVMQSVLSDNGGEFSNEEIREVASILSIRLFTTAADSPHQNGLCERVHGVIDNILLKLMDQHRNTSIEVLLGWANMAKNSMHMHHGYSPYQLVFGQNPSLPNIMTEKAPALEGKTMRGICSSSQCTSYC